MRSRRWSTRSEAATRLGCGLVGLVLGGLVGAGLGWIGFYLLVGKEGLTGDPAFGFPIISGAGGVVGAACGAYLLGRMG